MYSCTVYMNKNKNKNNNTANTNHSKCKVDPAVLVPRWHTAHQIYRALANCHQCFDLGDVEYNIQSWTILTHIFLEASSLTRNPVLSFLYTFMKGRNLTSYQVGRDTRLPNNFHKLLYSSYCMMP